MPSAVYKEILKAQRENEATARAGLRWEKDEDEKLLKMVSDKIELSEIAKTFKRTEGSIKTRLILSTIRKIDNENMSLCDAAKFFSIDENDVSNYLEKKAQREDRKANKIKTFEKVNSKMISITDVYNLVNKIDKKIETLLSK